MEERENYINRNINFIQKDIYHISTQNEKQFRLVETEI